MKQSDLPAPAADDTKVNELSLDTIAEEKKEDEKAPPPAEFSCVITLDLMEDPVMLPECGHTFERSAILGALNATQYKKCPQCRAPTQGHVVPNHNLRNMIQDSKWGKKDEKKNDKKPKQVKETSKPTLELLTCPITKEVVLAITGPDVKTRQNLDLILAIDTSGSMNAAADLKGPGKESTGMNTLDVVRAVGIVIASSLPEYASCAILEYSSRSDVKLEPTTMTAAGKKKASDIFLKLEPGGATNLWDSIKQAFGAAREDGVIINLSDGEPSRHLSPHGGFQKAVADLCKDFSKKLEEPPMQFMFGYGQNLQTQTMCDVSRQTGGSYVYVADPNFVCTAAAHTLGNVKERVDHAAKLTLDGKTVKFQLKKAAKTHLVLGPKAAPKKAAIKYIIRGARQAGEQAFEFDLSSVAAKESEWATFHVARSKLVNILERIPTVASEENLAAFIREVKEWDKNVAELLGKMTKDTVPHAAVSALLFDSTRPEKDAEGNTSGGQVLMAAESQFFGKWGNDYLQSLLDAHKNEAANNFKDKSMKFYGGETFKTMRDNVSSTFNKLPAPRCSLTERRASQARFGGGPQQRVQAAPRAMSYYNNASRPCIVGDTLVQCRRGSAVWKLVPASDLTPGDEVFSASGKPAKIEKVFIFEATGNHEVVRLSGGLAITPHHPVHKKGGVWVYPINVVGATLEKRTGGLLVDLLLEHGESFAVGKYNVAAWGHGHTNPAESPVLGHSFFGSRVAIRRAFEGLPGWDQGVVRVGEDDLQAIRAAPTQAEPVGLVQSYTVSPQTATA